MKIRTCIVMCILASSASAQQELASINDVVAAIPDDLHATAYMSSRCAGLFDGVVAYGGQNMPEETVKQYHQASATLTIGSTLIRLRQTKDRGLPAKDPNKEMENSVGEMVSFSEMYKNRFNTNYQLSGTMMERDQVAIEDLTLCSEAVPRIKLNRAGFAGGSNSLNKVEHHEQDSEQVFP